MKVIADNIIFALQRYGGISVVWQELLSRAREDQDLQLTELDYRDRTLRRLERYRIPDYKADPPAIFHSSYFRILPQKQVYNVTTVHDLTYHFYRHGPAKAVHLWEEQRALRHSEAVICISRNTKRDLLRCYPWVDEARIHIVPNGVSEVYRPLPEVEKQGYLLYVGNSTAAYKRYDLAQEVARQTGLRLVTARDVTPEQLNRLYNEALCLLYPSDYEGFGLPVLEAQRAGCPVVAQNASSIPEVIGEGGLLVAHDTPARMATAMAERVRQLLSQSTQEIIAAGRENAKRFSWDKTYAQTKQVYENIYHNHHL
ncbi:MAG: glycosyltransferase family 4 protein [Paludibacteraceae bacterium]|nr:glycosyltransferase family 4 protein [Paludibacteraceae bacterium]